MNDFYIFHGGPGSGRYPWGSGERPYQRLEQPKGLFRKRKYKKAMKTEAERQRQMELSMRRKQQILTQKDAILQGGSARQVMQLQGMLTNDELRRACERLDYERRISNYTQDEIDRNMKRADHMMKNLGKMVEWGKTSIDAYNLIASVANSKKGKDQKLPYIQRGGGGQQQNQQQNPVKKK